jgi:hypothetical protein
MVGVKNHHYFPKEKMTKELNTLKFWAQLMIFGGRRGVATTVVSSPNMGTLDRSRDREAGGGVPVGDGVDVDVVGGGKLQNGCIFRHRHSKSPCQNTTTCITVVRVLIGHRLIQLSNFLKRRTRR